MTLKGEMFIGAQGVKGSHGGLQGVEAATARRLEPVFGGAGPEDLEAACRLADQAFEPYRHAPLEQRARLLERIADNIAALGDALIERMTAETGLPRARCESERRRTCDQLRLFADVVRDGAFLGVRIDPAIADRLPAPRADLRLCHVPLGPVAVFGASNFPLAFSVAGGDTAAALAAGCPVVVKAHSAHPGVSELVGRAVQAAVADCGLPPGVFSMLFDATRQIGAALVADARIKAVGFTGSRAGGLALMAIAQSRPEPIPVYAEMSSLNPVILLSGALIERAEAIAQAFVASLVTAAGQFCTNPGLLIAVEGPALDRFEAETVRALAATPAATMLTPGIHAAYERGVAAVTNHQAVETLGRGLPGGVGQGQAAVLSTHAEAFLSDRDLHAEMFGAAALLVRCPDLQTITRVVSSLEGQLTAAIHFATDDLQAAQALLPLMERKAGRIIANGFGVGVEVTHAMVHGGPYPSTSDGRSTAVGSLAIGRFLRPVCYQDLPAALLPDELRDDLPFRSPRLWNGRRAET